MIVSLRKDFEHFKDFKEKCGEAISEIAEEAVAVSEKLESGEISEKDAILNMMVLILKLTLIVNKHESQL